MLGRGIFHQELSENRSVGIDEGLAFVLQCRWKDGADFLESSIDGSCRLVVLNDTVNVADDVFAEGTFRRFDCWLFDD